jgi:glucose uptake protein GlcU
MDKDTQFAVLVIGIPFLGLAYCGLIFAVMIYWVWGREHPVTMATFFVLAPSLISGSIWLLASYKARQKQRLGL